MTSGDLTLIRTKLAPPRVGNAPVTRTELLDQLEQRRNRKLTLMVGPAGSGKTMLLTQWRQKLILRGARVAWYNVGVDDNDLHIAAYIVEALSQAGLPMDKESLQVYVRSAGKAWRPFVTSLINDIGDQDGDVYLFIDDLHHISSFSMLKLLDLWLAMAPGRFHLVLSSRSRPPLQLARLRAEDDLTELQFPELKFSQEETHRFLQAQGLSGLSAAQEHALQEITDGWAAGLQLLAFSLRKQKDPEQLFERQGKLSLSRADALEEYLETVVTEHLSETEFGFLVRISACRRFSRELCELITGDPRAGELLARFEKENLFLFPIDTADAEPWYRFHRLFAGYLNHRLQKLDPAEVRKINQLAAHWFAGKNLHLEAMRHANLAGDTGFVVQLIGRSARNMLNGANFVELIKWCEAVPRESLRSRLDVCLCLAWAQLSCSRLEDFERTMQDIALHPDRQLPEAAMETRLLRAYHSMISDDTAASLEIVEPIMREPPLVNDLHALLLSNIASLSLVMNGEFERGREVARQRHQVDITDRPDYPKPLVDITDGFSHLLQGNIRQAAASISAYVDDALQRASSGVDAAGLFSGYLLEALYQSGALQSARIFLARYLDLIDAVGVTDSLLFAYRVKARIHQIDGQFEAALDTLRKLEETGYQKRLDRMVAWSLQEQVALALQGRGVAIAVDDLLLRLRQLAERYRHHHRCAWTEIGLAARLAEAMAAFSRGPGAEAIATIEAAEAYANENRRSLQATRLGLMRAAALLQGGQAAESMALGRRMIAAAAEAGMMRVLPELGRAALPLAQRLLEDETEPQARALLEAACRELGGETAPVGEARRAAGAAERGGNESLSTREQEVLELLSKALSIKSIARVLTLSPGTVKWHVKNIYEKLHATSREDALVKARNLNYLS